MTTGAPDRSLPWPAGARLPCTRPRSQFAKLLARAGDEAKIGFNVHPHMLLHARGYAWRTKGWIRERCRPTLGITQSTRLHAMPR